MIVPRAHHRGGVGKVPIRLILKERLIRFPELVQGVILGVDGVSEPDEGIWLQRAQGGPEGLLL